MAAQASLRGNGHSGRSKAWGWDIRDLALLLATPIPSRFSAGVRTADGAGDSGRHPITLRSVVKRSIRPLKSSDLNASFRVQNLQRATRHRELSEQDYLDRGYKLTCKPGLHQAGDLAGRFGSIRPDPQDKLAGFLAHRVLGSMRPARYTSVIRYGITQRI